MSPTTWAPLAVAAIVLAGGATVAPRLRRPRSLRPGTDSLGAEPRTRSGRERVRGGRPLMFLTVFAIAGLAVVALGLIPTGAVIAAVYAARQARPLVNERRRRSALAREFPDAIELLVLVVHAGLTPHQALRAMAHAAPTSLRPAFAEVVRRTERGQSLADALRALPELVGAQAVGLADVIATADRYGLPLGPVLDQLAGEARAARRRLGEAAARRLPIRLSFPLVVCTLPSFILLAIAPAVIAALSSLGGSAW